MKANLAEPPRAEAGSMQQDEFHERAVPLSGYRQMPPLDEKHEGPKQNDARDVGNHQAPESLADVLLGGPPAEREPGAGACNQKEEGHAPGKEQAEDDRDRHAQLGVLDVPIVQVEGMHGVEKKNA